MNLQESIFKSLKEDQKRAMKVKSLYVYRLFLTGVLFIGFCVGCANLDQKIKDSKLTQKMKDWQVALNEKFSKDDAHASDQKNAANSGKDSSLDASSKVFVHIVQRRGETFRVLAMWYTGNTANDKKIARANPNENPYRLRIGSHVDIPSDMLKTRKPMSRVFAAKHLPSYYEHKICWQGETLSLVSKWYTGKHNNWKKLVNHNPEVNPNRIKIGQKVYIPNYLLKTRNPLPRKFAAKGLPNYFAYTVKQPGERLPEIAGWYTGDSKNWQHLAKANPDLDPDYLLVGNEIYIPAKLLKTRDPIPLTAGAAPEQKPSDKSPAQNTETTKKKENEIQLFGPKQFPKG
jgi:hypothetical protein